MWCFGSPVWSPVGARLLGDCKHPTILEGPPLHEVTWLDGYTVPRRPDATEFSQDGREVLVMKQASLYRWSLATGAVTPLAELSPLPRKLWVSPDWRRIAAEGDDGRVTLSDVGKSPSTPSLARTLPVDMELSWSPDGSRLATSTKEHLEIWSAVTGERIRAVPCPDGESLDIAPPRWPAEGTTLFFGCSFFKGERRFGRVRALDLASGRLRGPWGADAFAIAGGRIYVSVPGKIQVVEVATGAARTIRQAPPASREEDSAGSVVALTVSADGRWLIVEESNAAGPSMDVIDTTSGKGAPAD